MTTVLHNLGLRYNPALIEAPSEPHKWDFSNPENGFIHGLIQGKGGVCSSVPVVYAAVGRRLGYPMKLVTAKSPLFTRWHDLQGERFNIEVNLTGVNFHRDEYYRSWPIRIKHDELRK